MGTLCYTPVSSEEELQGFDCGNASINDMISRSFYPHILKQIKASKISIQGKCVGFYSISILGISLEHSDAPLADYFDGSSSFGAVMLNYLAIDKRIHHRNIGSNVLKYVISEVQSLYRIYPIRLLVLDALMDKVGWYTKFGFVPINQKDLTGPTETVRMFLDIMPDEDKQYIEKYTDYYYC